MPTLTQLEYIVAIDRYRHFGKAARACHISQPTLSMQVQKAEEEVGCVIFDRDQKPILPTEKGARFIAQAHIVLEEHARLLQLSTDDSKEPRGPFTLGIIPTLAPYLLPRFVNPFLHKYPKVVLTIEEHKTEDIINGFRNHTLDAAILATPLHERGIRERVLFYEPFYLFVNSEHRLVSRAEVHEKDLRAEDVWLLRDGHCFRNQILNFCGAQGGRHSAIPNFSFEAGNFETLRNLIRNGPGYTLFPYLFVSALPAKEKSSCVRPFVAPIPTREVSLVQRRGHWKSDIVEALFAVIESQLPPELRSVDRSKITILPI